MSRTLELDMSGMKLAPKIEFGCVRLTGADKLPLSQLFLVAGKPESSITFWGDTRAPWDDMSLVSIRMFQLPAGKQEFEEAIAFFAQDRRKRTRLPEGVPFDETVLALKHPPANATHDAFATSQRCTVHTYQTGKMGVLIRWLSRAGTVLDHPLLKRIQANLQIDERQWVTIFPEAIPKKAPRPTKAPEPLAESARREIAEAVAQARQALKVKAKARPAAIADAVYQAIDAARAERKAPEAQRVEMAVNLGALWGEALCAATQWYWSRMPLDAKRSAISVTTPDGSHAVDPIRMVFDLLGNRRVPNNSLLLFNMIAAGDLPPRGQTCCWLS